jgi:hypothetical protein
MPNPKALLTTEFVKNDDILFISKVSIEIEEGGALRANFESIQNLEVLEMVLNQTPNKEMQYPYSFNNQDNFLSKINVLQENSLLSAEFALFISANINKFITQAQSIELENQPINNSENAPLPFLTRTATSLLYQPPTPRLVRTYARANLATFFTSHANEAEYDPRQFGPDVPRSTDSIPLPTLGINAEKVERLAILNEEIPIEMLCCISGAVMTDPVYFTGLPHYIYDRLMIQHALLLNPSDPFTRQPRTTEELQSDTDLKNNIEFFLQQAELKANNQENQFEVAKQRFTKNSNNTMTPQ